MSEFFEEYDVKHVHFHDSTIPDLLEAMMRELNKRGVFPIIDLDWERVAQEHHSSDRSQHFREQDKENIVADVTNLKPDIRVTSSIESNEL